ncbi:MAG: tetratricopeptide repeat protein [Thermodesulfobacteriota bacterium]
MSDEKRIRSSLREAEIYRKQGLFEESKEKYEEIFAFLQSHEKYSKNKRLLKVFQDKIKALNANLDEVEKASELPDLPENVHKLIRQLFSFSENEETAEMEGAIALAKFGQYEQAIHAFTGMIQKWVMPLVAAKNALRCHVTLASPDAAVAQFEQWLSQKTFSAKELRFLRSSLEDHLARRGIAVDISEVSEPDSEPPPEELELQRYQEPEVIDISSFRVQLTKGSRKGKTVEFEVSFQSGNKVSTIIPAQERDLMNSFEPGLRLNDIQFFSPLAVFNGMGIVSGINKISSGPRRGDYSLDITIEEA